MVDIPKMSAAHKTSNTTPKIIKIHPQLKVINNLTINDVSAIALLSIYAANTNKHILPRLVRYNHLYAFPKMRNRDTTAKRRTNIPSPFPLLT